MAVCLIIIFDQLFKGIIKRKIGHNQRKEIIKNKLYLTNIRNSGAAYGLLKDSPVILFILTSFTLITISYYFIMALYNDSTKALKLGLTFILGGGMGNVIDRASKRYVTDYIYINKKDFPVFNMADFFILTGAVILYVRAVFQER